RRTPSRAAVLRVTGAIAARPAERSERRDDRALDRDRRPHRPAELGELVEDHGELQQRRVAAGSDLAVARKPEQGLEQDLGLERGPQGEPRPYARLADRDDPMLRIRWDDHHVARTELLLATCDDEPECALEHLVALLLSRVQVIARREATRDELELVLEHFAARLRARPQKGEPVAPRGVLEHLACAGHAATLRRPESNRQGDRSEQVDETPPAHRLRVRRP